MPAVLVDSNVLLDVISLDPVWFRWSSESLRECSESSRLVINPIIYAEVSIRFTQIEGLEEALPRQFIEREAIPFDAAFLAGKAFSAYRRRGGSRRSTLPDFFIGAHAAVRGYRVLTRDPTRYRSYFPSLGVIAPS